MHRRGLQTATLAALAATLLAGTPASAQVPSVIGLWTSSQMLPDGAPYATYAIQFDAAGNLQERMITTAGVTDYFGQYRFDPNSGALQFVFTDYAPKMDCTFACIPIQPIIPIGQSFTVQLQFQSAAQFVWVDGGTPMVFVRQ